MSESVVTQKLVVDAADARATVRSFNSELRSASMDMGRSLTESSKAFAQNDSQVRKWGETFKGQMAAARKEFADNLATGAKALTLDAAAHAINRSTADAIELAADASKAFADLKSRVNATDEQFASWQKNIGSAAVSTKANLATMQQAFVDLTDSADPDQIMKFMDTIGGATVMSGGHSKPVTDFLKNSVLGQGKELNKMTVDEMMTGADLLRRRGRGFGTLESSMSALGGLDQTAIRNSGLSERDIASMIAGASKSGMTSNQAVAGISALLKANNNGITEGSVLSSVLGVSGKGSLMDGKGNLNVAALGGHGTYQRLLQLGGGNETRAMEIFRKTSGVSEDASDAIFKMIKNFKDFSAVMSEAEHDTKKFSQSAQESSDNFKDIYQQMQNKMVIGFKDIIGPAFEPVKSLMSGHPIDALMGAPKAGVGMLEGIGHHLPLAAGALLATAGGGMLLKSLAGKIPGVGGLIKGAAGGAIAKQMGAEPVYVVNASDMGGGVGEEIAGKMMSPIAAIMKGLGIAAIGTGGAVAGGAALGYVAGTAINDALDAHADTNKYGEKFNPIEKGIAKLTPQWAGGMTHEQWVNNYTAAPVKVHVEVDSRDPMFSARPKATDNPRDGRVQ